MKSVLLVALTAAQLWVGANEARIAKVHDAHQRARMHTEFARAQKLLAGFHYRNPAPRDPHQTARDILRARGYHLSQASITPPRTLWDRIWGWIVDRWTQLWNALFSRAHVGGRETVAIGDLLLLGAIAAFLFFGMRVLVAALAPMQAQRSGGQPLDARESAAALHARALEAAARGNFAGAISFLFAAALHAMGMERTSAQTRALTIGKLRIAVGERFAPCKTAFDTLARALTMTLYADRPATAEDFAQSLDAYQRITTVTQGTYA